VAGRASTVYNHTAGHPVMLCCAVLCLLCCVCCAVLCCAVLYCMFAVLCCCVFALLCCACKRSAGFSPSGHPLHWGDTDSSLNFPVLQRQDPGPEMPLQVGPARNCPASQRVHGEHATTPVAARCAARAHTGTNRVLRRAEALRILLACLRVSGRASLIPQHGSGPCYLGTC
jgi:hypothetical protein